MKRPEYRERLSVVAKHRTPDHNRKIGESLSRLWAEGRFDGVRVGKCDWYLFTDANGTEHKVQGTWELAFAKWLSDSGLKFLAHRGRLHYKDDSGRDRNYYPDFWVFEWSAWVDIKCDHFYKPDKFRSIRLANRRARIHVLKLRDLQRMGVELYGTDGRHTEAIRRLVDECRIGKPRKMVAASA